MRVCKHGLDVLRCVTVSNPPNPLGVQMRLCKNGKSGKHWQSMYPLLMFWLPRFADVLLKITRKALEKVV